jgi:Delta14-sterol reductase
MILLPFMATSLVDRKYSNHVLMMQLTHVYSLGTLGITLGLPTLVYAFLFACNDVSGCPAPSLLSPKTFTLDKLKQDINWQGWHTFINPNAFYATLGWYAFSLLLYTILPATEVEGTALRSGGRLKYRFNSKSVHCVT